MLLLVLTLPACREGMPWPLARGGEAVAPTPIEAVLAAPPRGAGVHIVRSIARAGRYTFEPAEVHIRPGDVVRFVHTDHQAQAVVFEVEGLPPEAAQLLLEQGALSSPLLTEPGAVFEIHFHDAPEGTYRFHSVPHAERGMRGAVIVSREGAPPAEP